MLKKLNVLLSVTDALRSKYKNLVNDYAKYFAGSQGAFKGEKRTYTAKENTIDDPGKRGIRKVVTTVDEKFSYFVAESERFIDAVFAQEKTNASGLAIAELKVEGESWGTFTSMELLRLKSLLESADSGNLSGMILRVPVRSDSEVWNETKDEDYTDRAVYETDMLKGEAKTTVKKPYILEDPNLSQIKDTSGYKPVTASRDDVFVLGDYTMQTFSGEWSHRQRAYALKRLDDLHTAVIEALKVANECEVVKSELNAKRLFGYILYGIK